jgi:arylsulfatase A-like enzyme
MVIGWVFLIALNLSPSLPKKRTTPIMSKHSLLLGFGFQLFYCLPPAFGAAEPSPEKPNVIVIIADDLGYGDVGCLSGGKVKTPNIDRLAQSGVKFTSGYVTAPLCGPSRAGFLTGRYQQRFSFRNNRGGIPTEHPLLPGVLHDAGYYTGLLGKWHSSGPMPHERGCFDETLCSHISGPFIDYYRPKLARNGKTAVYDEYSTDLFAREAEDFIERNKSKPFALTIAFNAPHILRVEKPAEHIRAEWDKANQEGKVLDIPKMPTARSGEAQKFAAQYPGDSARADTVATIDALDQAVGRIIDKLQEAHLNKKTMIFLFADNGGHPENRSENLPLRDYKWELYEGGIRVPFLATYPGVFPEGFTYTAPVSTLDIFPTVTAHCGITPPDNLDGVNLTPYLKGQNKELPHNELYFSMHDKKGPHAIRANSWKLVMDSNGGSYLFDLSKDLGEKNDLGTIHPARVQELTAKLKAWSAQMPIGDAGK